MSAVPAPDSVQSGCIVQVCDHCLWTSQRHEHFETSIARAWHAVRRPSCHHKVQSDRCAPKVRAGTVQDTVLGVNFWGLKGKRVKWSMGHLERTKPCWFAWDSSRKPHSGKQKSTVVILKVLWCQGGVVNVVPVQELNYS